MRTKIGTVLNNRRCNDSKIRYQLTSGTRRVTSGTSGTRRPAIRASRGCYALSLSLLEDIYPSYGFQSAQYPLCLYLRFMSDVTALSAPRPEYIIHSTVLARQMASEKSLSRLKSHMLRTYEKLKIVRRN